jgi:DNA repair photolyase
MIKEIKAKALLNSVRQPDDWFGLMYNMNLYRGCQYQCIYCDSRSACYQIENFSDVLVKTNAIDLLRIELSRKRVKGTIGFGSMNDPYMPVEVQRNLTRQALQVIAEFRFPVHIITKSNLVLRDLDILCEINQVYAAISITITTADDALGKKIEPGAPKVSERFKALQVLAENGITAGITLMPVLPFLEDDFENIHQIVFQAHRAGVGYITPSFGMSLRDRQREYYYQKLDRFFPGLRQQYQRTYGDQFRVAARNSNLLEGKFKEWCRECGIATRMPRYSPPQDRQMHLITEHSNHSTGAKNNNQL